MRRHLEANSERRYGAAFREYMEVNREPDQLPGSQRCSLEYRYRSIPSIGCALPHGIVVQSFLRWKLAISLESLFRDLFVGMNRQCSLDADSLKDMANEDFNYRK